MTFDESMNNDEFWGMTISEQNALIEGHSRPISWASVYNSRSVMSKRLGHFLYSETEPFCFRLEKQINDAELYALGILDDDEADTDSTPIDCLHLTDDPSESDSYIDDLLLNQDGQMTEDDLLGYDDIPF